MARRSIITMPSEAALTRPLQSHDATTDAVGRRGLFSGISRAAQARMKEAGAAKGVLPDSGLSYFYSKFADSIDPIFDKIGRDEMTASEFFKHLKSAGVSDREIDWYRLRDEFADDETVGRQELIDFAASKAPDIAAVWNYGDGDTGWAHDAAWRAGLDPRGYKFSDGRHFGLFTKEADDDDTLAEYVRNYGNPEAYADEITSRGEFDENSDEALAAEFLSARGADVPDDTRDLFSTANAILDNTPSRESYQTLKDILARRGHRDVLEAYGERKFYDDMNNGELERPVTGFAVRADGRVFELEGYRSEGNGTNFRILGGDNTADMWVDGADVPRLMTAMERNKFLTDGYDLSRSAGVRPAFGDVIPEDELRWSGYVSPLAKKPRSVGEGGRAREVAIYGDDADGFFSGMTIDDSWGHAGLSRALRHAGRGSMFHWRGHDADGPQGTPDRGIRNGSEVVDLDRRGFLEVHEGQSDYVTALREAEYNGTPIEDLPVSSSQSAAKNIINHAIRHAIESGMQGVYLPDPLLPAAAWKQIYGPPPQGTFNFTFAAGPDGRLNAQPIFSQNQFGSWLKNLLPDKPADRLRITDPIPADSYEAARRRIDEMTLHGNPIFASEDADGIARQIADLASGPLKHGGTHLIHIKGLPQDRLLMSNSYDAMYKTMAGEAERAAKELGGEIVAEKPDPRDRYGWHRRALMFTPQFIEGFRRGRPWAFSLAAMLAQPVVSALNSAASSAGYAANDGGA